MSPSINYIRTHRTIGSSDPNVIASVSGGMCEIQGEILAITVELAIVKC